jgi:hypothetical protein
MYNLAIKAFFFSQTSDEMEVFIMNVWIVNEETKGQAELAVGRGDGGFK